METPDMRPEILRNFVVPHVIYLARHKDVPEEQRAARIHAFLDDLSLWGMWRDILDFHAKFGCHTPTRVSVPPAEIRELRKKLQEEEARELGEAMDAGDVPAIVQESIDNIYVALGNIASCGVNPLKAWRAVHGANMKKERNPTGGKILKPPGWQKPDVKSALQNTDLGLV